MYVGSHYNSYYNTLYGNVSALYSKMDSSKVASGTFSLLGANLLDQNAFSSSALKYVTDIKESGADLRSSLNGLTSGAAFRQKNMVSSDTQSMTITSSMDRYALADASDITVKIDQVASGQVNEGAQLKAGQKAGINGTNQFSIEIDGKKHQFAIQVSASDTNKDVQRKMADVINAGGFAITATVEENKGDQTSMLKLQSSKVGAGPENEFVVKDVLGSAVAKTGANNITQGAQDAIYRVNGGDARTSKTNTVALSNNVTATLKKASSDEITVSAGTDRGAAEKQINEMVNSYNRLYGATLENAEDSKSNRLFTKITSISRTYSSALNKVGIGFDQNGYMTVNKEQMEKSLQDGSLERFLTEGSNANFGFANQLSRAASDVINNTSRYVSQASISQSLFDPSSTYGAIDTMLLKNNPYYNSGLLFDFWL